MRSSSARNTTNSLDLQVSGSPIPGSIPIFDVNGGITSSIVLINNLGNITTPGALVAGSVPPDPTTPGYQMDYLNTNTINEKTSGNGVTISGTSFKSGEIKCLTGITLDTGSNRLVIPSGILTPTITSSTGLVLTGSTIGLAASAIDCTGANLGNIGTLTANAVAADSLVIAGQSFISGSTLGSFVTQSSLTKVGELTNGSIGSGFGAINIGSNSLQCGAITATGLITATTLRAPSGLFHLASTSNVIDRVFIGSTSSSESTISVLSLRGKNPSSQSPIVLSAWDLTTGSVTATQSALTITDGVERVVITADSTDIKNRLKATGGLAGSYNTISVIENATIQSGYLITKLIVASGNAVAYMPSTAVPGDVYMICARINSGASLLLYPSDYGSGSICGALYIPIVDKQMVILYCTASATWDGGYQ